MAETESEKDAAQALRYRVFYEEMGAIPNENIRNLKRDFDEYDEFSDYLLVIDYNKISDHERVVGTYRLIRKENADKAGGFTVVQNMIFPYYRNIWQSFGGWSLLCPSAIS